MLIKRIILTTILILWIVLIFTFSHQNGTKSESTSDNFVEVIIDKVNLNMTEEEQDKFIIDTRVIVRKTAHFTIYFVLGILSYLTLKSYNLKRAALFSIILTLIYAITDELHQLFITDRSSSIIDVLIDFSGSLTGIAIMYLIFKLINKTKNSA